jgi:anti-sigma B factor antagonist
VPSERPPAFSVSVREEDGRTVVAPCGEIDLTTSDHVRAALASASGPLRVLDLREVSFLDTSGLRIIIEYQRLAESDGHGFAVVAGPPAVQRLFDIAGLTDRLEFLGGGEAPGRDGAGA